MFDVECNRFEWKSEKKKRKKKKIFTKKFIAKYFRVWHTYFINCCTFDLFIYGSARREDKKSTLNSRLNEQQIHLHDLHVKLHHTHANARDASTKTSQPNWTKTSEAQKHCEWKPIREENVKKKKNEFEQKTKMIECNELERRRASCCSCAIFWRSAEAET